ncbi:nitroreductase [Persicobacter psychrovividus]|uniref:Putative NAD(P)H nitroreductase n=1 Tax=Persicobacter psychrovividus TaxID=387638 RepID=A0ABN6L3X8_9BACT|nr:NAD(P)H nitroreductase [Persicobacter psychrovividus]
MNLPTDYIDQLIAKRRSIYPDQYTGEVIDDGVIEQLLENARWAPTHKLTQPWAFTVFTGAGLQQLADFQSTLYKKVAEEQGTFKEEKFQKLANKPLKSSHIIAIGMRRDPKQLVPEVEEVAAVAMAVQNMYLSATAYGIGCYWGSGGVTYFPEAKAFFDLGEEDQLLGFLYLGVPEKWPLKHKRAPLSEKVRWVR